MIFWYILPVSCNHISGKFDDNNWHIPKPVEVVLKNHSTLIEVDPYTSVVVDSQNKELLLHAYKEVGGDVVPQGSHSSAQIHGVVFGKEKGFVRIDTRYSNQSVHILQCPISDNFHFIFSYQRSMINYLFEKSWKEISNGTLGENYKELINSKHFEQNFGRVKFFKYISMFGNMKPKQKMSYPFLNNIYDSERPTFIIKSKYPIRVVIGSYTKGNIKGEEYTGKELVISPLQILPKYYLQLYNPFKFDNNMSILIIRTSYFALSRKLFLKHQESLINDYKTSMSLFEKANQKIKIRLSKIYSDIRIINDLDFPTHEKIGYSMFVSTIDSIYEDIESSNDLMILSPEPYFNFKNSIDENIKLFELPFYEVSFEETNLLNISQCGSIIFTKKEDQHIFLNSGDKISFDEQSIGINSGLYQNSLLKIESQANMFFYCPGFRFANQFFVIHNINKRSKCTLKVNPMHQRALKDISRRSTKFKLGNGVQKIEIEPRNEKIQTVFIGEPHGIVYIESIAGSLAEFYTLENGEYLPRYISIGKNQFIGFHFGNSEGAILIKHKGRKQVLKMLVLKDPYRNPNTYEILIEDLIKETNTPSDAKYEISSTETTKTSNKKVQKTTKYQIKSSFKPQNVHTVIKIENKTSRKYQTPYHKAHKPLTGIMTLALILIPVMYWIWKKYKTRKNIKLQKICFGSGNFILECNRIRTSK